MQTYEHVQAVSGMDAGTRFHPGAIILAWVLLAVAMQILPVAAMFAAGSLVLAMAAKFATARLYGLLRRTRWIMLTLLLVYGYVTPGAALWPQGGMFSPTAHGLSDGIMQLSRLVFMLAGLAIVLGMLVQQQLMAGLYALLYPVRYVGLSRERIAVRLALTLAYAESAMRGSARDWRAGLEQALAPVPDRGRDIVLHTSVLTWRDGVLLTLALAVLVLAVL